jgi:protein-S-isoprenylcysteine O-methyltransferase Ste14
MNLFYHRFFPVVWTAFAVYWFGSALRVKRISHGESRRERLVRFLLVVFAAALVFSPKLSRGPLDLTLLPHSKSSFFTGAAILLAGLGFAVWARLHLGAYWSAMVAVKEGHRLIQTGPYRMVRHPIYSGILAGYVGTAVAVGQLRSFVGAALLIAIYYRKSQNEEHLLSVEFAEEYPAYRKQAGALIPVSGPPQIIFWSATVVVFLILLIGFWVKD